MLANALRASGYTNVEPIAHARGRRSSSASTGRVRRDHLDVVVEQRPRRRSNTALLRRTSTPTCTRGSSSCSSNCGRRGAGVNKAAEGTLSSYGHVLSAIHFLQAGVDLADATRPAGARRGRRNIFDPKWQFYDGIDCRFGDPRSWTPPRRALGGWPRSRGWPSSSFGGGVHAALCRCRAAEYGSQARAADAARRASWAQGGGVAHLRPQQARGAPRPPLD